MQGLQQELLGFFVVLMCELHVGCVCVYFEIVNYPKMVNFFLPQNRWDCGSEMSIRLYMNVLWVFVLFVVFQNSFRK